jgi:transcriptional regulator with XRE-family HTH domain
MLSPDWLPATFSKVLHKRREALGISQEELSKRSGLHRTYISDVERGARNVSLKNMGRLSVALEVTPSVLMRWAEMVYSNETVDFANTSVKHDFRPEMFQQHLGTTAAVCHEQIKEESLAS